MIDRARVVVIGGGVGGCSILYWLARLGCADAVLLERAQLTSGSTFHSAGLVGQLRGSLSLTRMMMHSVELYRELGDEVGLDTGWREVGSLRLASSTEHMEELRRQAAWAETFGLPLQLISAADARALFPPMSTDGVLGAALLSTDGYLEPSQLTFALAKGARQRGAQVLTGVRVEAIRTEGGRVRGVDTDQGPIECEVVVNAGGIYAHHIGRLAGVDVPVVPMAHQYAITKAAGLPVDMPTVRDPSLLVYFRPQGGGLVAGGYERNPVAWGLNGIPEDFNNQLLAEDWDRFAPLFEAASRRVPELESAEIVSLVNGPEAFTPDGEFLLGETDMAGFWVAAGFCAHGIAGAGGMGRLVAHWILEGQPELDAWEMDIRRFGPQYKSRQYALARTTEVYATYYDVKYPGHERQAGRPLRQSPLYSRHADLDAAFGEKGGWERVNWFASHDALGDEGLRPAGWAGRLWAPAIGAEHRACRATAAIFDETSFAKLEVTGAGAAAFLERLCANRVARDLGRLTYTQLLNPRGGVECDLTVVRLGEDRFRLVTGTALGNHDAAWIRSHLDTAPGVRVDDCTSRYGCLAVWGPEARRILQPLTSSDLSNAAFPYLSAQEVSIGPVPCLAQRVTFVGELGFELYCPTEYTAALWDLLVTAGAPVGLLPAGYRAIESLRLEKGYRVWGSDVTAADTPMEAGLEFAVRMGKGDFIGRAALAAAGPPARRLACLVLDDPRLVVLGSEPVRVGGRPVGRVTSGGYGYTVERSIAYAYLPTPDAVAGRRVELDLFGAIVGATVADAPLYDPGNERVRS